MGIEQVRLYTNTFSQIPGVFQDVTANFPGTDPSTVVDETVTGTVTVSNLTPGTKHFFWTEVFDEAGNTSGIVPVGSRQTKERYYAGYGADNTGIVVTASSIGAGTPNAMISTERTVFTSGSPGPQWVQYELPEPRKLTRYRIVARATDNAFRPRSWQILGSNDGVDFVVVHDVVLPEGTSIPAVNWRNITNIVQIPDEEMQVEWPYNMTPFKFYRYQWDDTVLSVGSLRI